MFKYLSFPTFIIEFTVFFDCLIILSIMKLNSEGDKLNHFQTPKFLAAFPVFYDQCLSLLMLCHIICGGCCLGAQGFKLPNHFHHEIITFVNFQAVIVIQDSFIVDTLFIYHYHK